MDSDPLSLLAQIRSGDKAAVGPLLKSYVNYLTLIARLQIGKKLQSKVDADDIVQETFLEACKAFNTFRGESEGELTAWLRQILANRMAMLLRRYFGTRGRDPGLERQLAVQLSQSSMLLDRGLAMPGSTPSQHVSRREQAVLLSQKLSRLPDEYREVIVMRHLEQVSFAEISERMGKSQDSVQKLWARGLKRLREMMEDAG